MFIILATLVCTSATIYGQQNVQEHISKIIKYFELASIKEFDTISFEKQINWGNNKWRIGDTSKICYEY